MKMDFQCQELMQVSLTDWNYYVWHKYIWSYYINLLKKGKKAIFSDQN